MAKKNKDLSYHLSLSLSLSVCIFVSASGTHLSSTQHHL